MKTEFWETHSGSCLLRMGMARQLPAADKPGGQLKSVPDASQLPRPHQAAGRNQGKGPFGSASGQGAQHPASCSTAAACRGCLWFGGFLQLQGFQFSELTLRWHVHQPLQTRNVCPCDLGFSECPGGALAVQPSMCWKHVRSGRTATSWRLRCLPSRSAQCGAKWSHSAGMGSGPSTRAKSTCFVLLALSWHPAERTMSAFWCSVSNKLT